MISSMTGFGRGETENNDRKFTVEIKAVNHRYFDVNIRMPKCLGQFESPIRQILKEYMQRGKTDLFITYEDFAQENVSLHYNEALAAQYMKYFSQMEQTFGIVNDIRVSSLARCPEVFTLEQQSENEDEIWSDLEKALRLACEQFVQSRRAEGENLKTDLTLKLEHMKKNVSLIEERYPKIIEEYTKRLEEKVHDLLGDTQLDDSRIAAELVVFSDKICTDEETVRLMSHIDSAIHALDEGGTGRKLDFIAQEMNREANTILSKANDLETSQIAIELKTEIEKVREQIQNIE